jgi:hypothetical protein
MRSALPLGLLITLYASANAATVRRFKPPEGHFRTYQRVAVQSVQRGASPTRFAVPGWTDEQTQYRLDNASAGSGLG